VAGQIPEMVCQCAENISRAWGTEKTGHADASPILPILFLGRLVLMPKYGQQLIPGCMPERFRAPETQRKETKQL